MLGYLPAHMVALVARYACLGGRGHGSAVDSGCAARGRNCAFSAGYMRADGHAKYVLKLWVEGKHGQLMPEEVRPKVAKAFGEFFDRVDLIFAECELGGPKIV